MELLLFTGATLCYKSGVEKSRSYIVEHFGKQTFGYTEMKWKDNIGGKQGG